MNNGVISKIYDAFKSQRKFLKIILFLYLSLLIPSCLEVKQGININKDGSGEARLEVAVQQEWASQIVPKLKGDMSKGWGIVEEKDKDGKHVVVFSRNFKDISELNDNEARYTFSSERKGFLKKSYTLDVKQLKSSDMPFPYEVTIKVPGSIDETNGIKFSSGDVKWNFQGLRRGTELTVKSSGFVIPDFASLKESFNKVFNSLFYKEAIVFLRDNNLWVMDSDGKNQRQLTKEGVEGFNVSKNGNIIFRKKEELFLLKLNGRLERVAEGLIYDADYSISPDGSKVIFSKGDDTLLYNLKDKILKKITFTPFPQILKEKLPENLDWQWFNDTIFTWSSDSKKIAFRRCSGYKEMPFCHLFLQDVAESNKPPTLVGEKYTIHGDYYSSYPIGLQNEMFFFATPADIYVYETATGKYFLLVKEGGWGGAKISPDGKVLTYLSGGNLWLMEIDNKNNRRLTNFQNMDAGHVYWFSDSNRIQFGIKPAEKPWEYQTWEINRDGYNLKKIADSQTFPESQYKTTIPKITFISPNIAKIIILVAIALTGILLLFGMALITRKAVKAVIPKIPKLPEKEVKPRGLFCSQCGKENPSTASFCVNCGQRLK